jgi:hypothetical protein
VFAGAAALVMPGSASAGGTATVVFDAYTLETITMFTSDSNNWAACARFPD